MSDMSLSPFVDFIKKACTKKAALLEESLGRYAARSIYAGAFLTLSTAAGAVAADQINTLHPSLGRFLFAFIFAFGLAYAVFLNGELATSNMMFLTAGAYSKAIDWKKALKVLLICSIFNLVGTLFAGYLLGNTAAFANLNESSAMVGIIQTKLARGNAQVFLEGIVANVLVNIAILCFVLVKDQAARLTLVLSAIFMFVYMTNEHVVANFASMSILLFSPFKGAKGFELVNVLRHWGVSYLGNLVGGGLLIGIVYTWLNQTKTNYQEQV